MVEQTVWPFTTFPAIDCPIIAGPEDDAARRVMHDFAISLQRQSAIMHPLAVGACALALCIVPLCSFLSIGRVDAVWLCPCPSPSRTKPNQSPSPRPILIANVKQSGVGQSRRHLLSPLTHLLIHSLSIHLNFNEYISRLLMVRLMCNYIELFAE